MEQIMEQVQLLHLGKDHKTPDLFLHIMNVLKPFGGREGGRDLWMHGWKEVGMDASMHACMHVGGGWMHGWMGECHSAMGFCAVLLVWLNMSRNLKCPCSVINNAYSLTLTISWVLSLLLAGGKLWAMIQRKCWCITKAHFKHSLQ